MNEQAIKTSNLIARKFLTFASSDVKNYCKLIDVKETTLRKQRISNPSRLKSCWIHLLENSFIEMKIKDITVLSVLILQVFK